MDATLVETQKRVALHSEFRDGKVPVGYEQLRVLQEALAVLPAGVNQVRLRSDPAGYQQELLGTVPRARIGASG